MEDSQRAASFDSLGALTTTWGVTLPKRTKDQAWLIEHCTQLHVTPKKWNLPQVEATESVVLTSRMWNRGSHKLSIFEWIEELLRQSMLHLHILHTWHWVQRPLCSCLESPPLTLKRTGGVLIWGTWWFVQNSGKCFNKISFGLLYWIHIEHNPFKRESENIVIHDNCC